ncbi:hypothetical protein [Novosphingobium aquae]|uniref:Phytoene synthase n=1 Tax=Novosphingobium aquae TaxID=3133435 RepID=A0ABU8S4Y7_9SPHN
MNALAMDAVLIDGLSPLYRLALAYAPGPAKPAWLSFLSLDTRLAGLLRQARDPVLAQIRLAWWRERLEQAPCDRPRGEPLLARFADWPDGGSALSPLVDGWEALLGDPPLPLAALESFAQGRAAGISALAACMGLADPAPDLARSWAMADLACHLGDPREQALALKGLADCPAPAGLPRALRPLLVLQRVSTRAARKGGAAHLTTPAALFTAMRAGLLGC